MITAVNGELYQVGSYIGATVSQGGGFRARIQQHDYETRRRLAGIITSRNTSKHYSFVGRHGVKEHNFIVAQMGLQDPKPPLLSFLLEAVLQAYLNVVEEAKDIKMWHRPAVSAFLGTMRASAASTPPDLSQFGLNTAWSLRQGGFKVPKEIKEQPYAVCVKREKGNMYLETPGDLLGKRLCRYQWDEKRRADPVWLANGPCIRCYRPRGFDKAPFTGQGPTSICFKCNVAVYRRLREDGESIQAEDLQELRDSIIDEGARERGGCAWCGAKEFGFAGQRFHDLGEARRCEDCFMHRKRHEDLERDPQDWDADVSSRSG
jgi:hypothetical protein